MPRLTVRRMMTLVAAVAFLLGAGVYGDRLRREAAYRRVRASDHAFIFETFSVQAENLRRSAADPQYREQAEMFASSARLMRSRAEFHAGMATKYADAARRPWESLAPDPREPRRRPRPLPSADPKAPK